MIYIIRGYDWQKFEERKQRVKNIAAKMNANYDEPRIIVDTKNQYYDMREVIERDMTVVNITK
ncbi:hypothetical protein ACI3E1_02995 [Ligilactobacillus sp. LYQ139]|uniref:hypothetical protein n=1 Tax=Ligilactobacillus sp. LYQ139 TaxID=3378800 RepID=UPI00385516FF